MIDLILKLIETVFDLFLPGKFKEMQIRVSKLTSSDARNIEAFIELYNETFPNNEGDYTANELLDAIEDPNNENRHVKADNIILIARFKDIPVGFITCFYYPEKGYGIIGHIGKTKSVKEIDSYIISLKLIKKLKHLLLSKRASNKCKLLLFELKKGVKDDAKGRLFSKYAKQLSLNTAELNFIYKSPKSSLEDRGEEEDLRLFIIPLNEEIKKEYSKSEILNLLDFIHFSCYGDYYEARSIEFNAFQVYLRQRMDSYSSTLPEIISIKKYNLPKKLKRGSKFEIIRSKIIP